MKKAIPRWITQTPESDLLIQVGTDDRLDKLKRALGIVSLGLLSLGVFGLGLHNLGNRYFWTDESSSFFTALGWPAPGQQPGGLDEIQQTLLSFLDPGLYHLMIRAWAETFGTGIASLRSLPYTFFIVYIITLLLWYRRVKLPLLIAVAGVSVMMLENITPYYAVEVRAYSAALAAAVALPLAAMWLSDRTSTARFVSFLLLGGFLGAMQYTAASVNIATGIVLIVAALRKVHVKERMFLLASGVFLLAWLPSIYLATRGLPTGGAEVDLDHVRGLVIGYMEPQTIAHTLTTNFLSFTALPRTFFLVLIPLAYLIAKFHRLGSNRFTRSDATSRDVKYLWIYVASLTASAGALSVGGFLPWVLGTRWSITEVAGIALSILGLLVFLRDFAPRELKSSQIAQIGIVVVSVIAVLVGALRLWTYERPGQSTALEELVPVLVSGDDNVPIVIDYWVFPDTRYWVEYSGEFDPWRQAWIDRGVLSTGEYEKAGSEAIQEFIESPSDRMLLRDEQPLREFGQPLPGNIDVIYPSNPGSISPDLSSAPVVLVKADQL